MDVTYIDPGKETPLQFGQLEGLVFRYAYARAAETRRNGGVGQDFLAFSQVERSFVFVVCDGVGQSFFGEIAAQSLTRALMGWMEAHRAQLQQPGIREDLVRFLDAERFSASRVVDAYPIPDEVPGMLRDVLEEKRALGSEAMFVCGCICLDSATYPSGAIFLAWMGDMRARIWRGSAERTELLGSVFETSQRWSTRAGLKGGRLNVFQAPLKGLDRLSVYSDGLAPLDDYPELPENPALANLIRNQESSPTSDDIAFLDIRFSSQAIPSPRLLQSLPLPVGLSASNSFHVEWPPVPGADFYQVAVTTDRGRIYQTPFTTFVTADSRLRPSQVRVRAIRDLVPGGWAEVQPATTAVRAKRTEKVVPSARKTVSVPWRVVVPFAAILAAFAIVLVGAIGFYLVFSPDKPESPQLSPPPVSQVVPATAAPTETPLQPTPVQAADLPSAVPSETAMGGKLPSPVPTASTPEPVDLNSGDCYFVAHGDGLLIFSMPGLSTADVLPPGTRLTMTGLEVVEPYLDRMWIWVEFERHEALVWVIFGPADLSEAFLEKCP